jgi:hypothetical protein
MRERFKKYRKYGIGFWSGAGIYSLINGIMNLNQDNHEHILLYDCIISGAAVIGLILNIFLFRETERQPRG